MSSEVETSCHSELHRVLCKYSDVMEVPEDDWQLVLDAYYLRKPLTGLEIYGKPIRRVREFVARLREFFFVEMSECPRLLYDPNRFNGHIFVSRFRTLPTVAAQYDGLSDIYSDLAGILYGYSLENIAEYCGRVTPGQFKWDYKAMILQTRIEK